ncbi:MAG: glycosyltransferase family 2 protein [Pirellulales bacterium]|nr:glycosyltransferase family 2 protein [Pirellulales bacterium]
MSPLSSNQAPLISCIMPTYGRPAYVDEAVAMFLDQDYPHKELIISNDCAGQTLVFDHPDVRIFNQETRFPTLGEKRNTCIELARGPLIAIWDDDDVYLPWRLSYSYRQMLRHQTPFYRTSHFWAYWGNENLHHNQTVPGWVSHAFAMFEKELWRRAGGYPARSLGEDTEFFNRIHQVLDREFIKYPIPEQDRFFVLRGKSRYRHMSIEGGENQLDTTPGIYQIEPRKIQDPMLRSITDRLINQGPTDQAQTHGGQSQTHGGQSQTHGSQPQTHGGQSQTHGGWSNGSTGPQPILSVCVALKNRSRIRHQQRKLELFPRCVESLAQAARDIGAVELIVADFQSQDWPLGQWLERAAGDLLLRVLHLDGEFSRGQGLNQAARQATGDCLLLLDADMLVTADLLARGIDAVKQGRAFFPIFLRLDPNGNPQSAAAASYGNAFVSRDLFQSVGGVPEFRSWGGEDDVFHDRIRQRVPVLREPVTGFQHQWHPDHCRHENYVNPIRSDYRQHLEQHHQTKPRSFDGKHPKWRSRLLLHPNGRIERLGIDVGRYDLVEQKSLTLHWDRWPAETLHWDSRIGAWHNPESGFILSEVLHS